MFPGALEEILTLALVENKVDFVKLLLGNGIIMREYLTVDRLEHLYNNVSLSLYLSLSLSYIMREYLTVDRLEHFCNNVRLFLSYCLILVLWEGPYELTLQGAKQQQQQ